jgi:hypothetical protein
LEIADEVVEDRAAEAWATEVTRVEDHRPLAGEEFAECDLLAVLVDEARFACRLLPARAARLMAVIERILIS